MIRMLDHTADVGFEVVEAPTLEDLFDETRQALLMTVFEESPERGEDEDWVWLSAPDLETLLVRWINELVFFIQGDGFVPVSADLRIHEDEKEGFYLNARLTGAPLNLEGYGWQGEIKSATFHGLAGAGDPGCLGTGEKGQSSEHRARLRVQVSHLQRGEDARERHVLCLREHTRGLEVRRLRFVAADLQRGDATRGSRAGPDHARHPLGVRFPHRRGSGIRSGGGRRGQPRRRRLRHQLRRAASGLRTKPRGDGPSRR